MARSAPQPAGYTEMRAVLVDWLLDVTQEFRLAEQTIFLAVQLLNCYTDVKLEEAAVPSVASMVHITANTFSSAQLISCEQDIMLALGHAVAQPTVSALLAVMLASCQAELVPGHTPPSGCQLCWAQEQFLSFQEQAAGSGKATQLSQCMLDKQHAAGSKHVPGLLGCGTGNELADDSELWLHELCSRTDSNCSMELPPILHSTTNQWNMTSNSSSRRCSSVESCNANSGPLPDHLGELLPEWARAVPCVLHGKNGAGHKTKDGSSWGSFDEMDTANLEDACMEISMSEQNKPAEYDTEPWQNCQLSMAAYDEPWAASLPDQRLVKISDAPDSLPSNPGTNSNTSTACDTCLGYTLPGVSGRASTAAAAASASLLVPQGCRALVRMAHLLMETSLLDVRLVAYQASTVCMAAVVLARASQGLPAWSPAMTKAVGDPTPGLLVPCVHALAAAHSYVVRQPELQALAFKFARYINYNTIDLRHSVLQVERAFGYTPSLSFPSLPAPLA
ncbi:hypothetical protein QJQ45_008191 [Haematococcus lacustris]|nr:hypothetical protein QJQ45_008191 [Haematococcus lacustris]